MEITPPIKSRTDKELFTIIGNDEVWAIDTQILAKEELLKRGYSNLEIQKKRKHLQRVISQWQHRIEKQNALNKSKSYSFIEMVLIVLFFPIAIFLNIGILEKFLELGQDNYKKKTLQLICLIIISIAFWLLILKMVL